MSNYRLTSKGWKAYNRMAKMHEEEIARQEQTYGEQNTEYGWSCIDDYDHIHNIDDDIDLLIYAYDADVIHRLVWIARHDVDINGKWSMNNEWGWGCSYKEVISRISERGLLRWVG